MSLIDFYISLHSGRRLTCAPCFVPYLAGGGTCSLFSAVKFASDCELEDDFCTCMRPGLCTTRTGLRSVDKSSGRL